MNLMQGVAELIPHFGIKASCSQLNVPRASYNPLACGPERYACGQKKRPFASSPFTG